MIRTIGLYRRGKLNFTKPVQTTLCLSIKRQLVTGPKDTEKSEKPKFSTSKAIVAVQNGLKSAAHSTIDMIRNPRETYTMIVDTAHHYWVGSKLLWAEIKLASQILGRVLQGYTMTRRERLQLIRTTMDLFRLVPFAIFVIVPFMELLLPFALRLFPNMLPSTFQDDLKKEEGMKKELQVRLALAGFLQETLQEMTSRRANNSEAQELIQFIEKARSGQPLPNESVIRIAKLFKDDFTLANIPRPQLVSMCQYMGISPYGADSFLRFQLRNKFRSIKEDDRRILWEGVESLTVQEIREACQVRGMRATGLASSRYIKQLKEWLDLSIQKGVPISLLIMSRAFNITSSGTTYTEDVLKSSISSLDSDTINEVVLSVATPEDESTNINIRKRKLESLQFQQEMIEEEREETAEIAKTKVLEAAKIQETKAKQTAAAAAAVEAAAATITSTTTTTTTMTAAQAVEMMHQQQAFVSDRLQMMNSSGNNTTTTSTSGTTSGVTTSVSGSSKGSTAVPPSIPVPTIITAEEVEAIGDLTLQSAVQREKAKLAILEANIEAVQTADATHTAEKLAEKKLLETLVGSSGIAGGGGDTQGVPVPETAATTAEKKAADKNIEKMKNVLNNMIDKLKVQIDTTEKALGDKLRLLDLDEDGEISAEEIQAAMMKILKRPLTPEEIDSFIKLVDRNGDGKVSVVELLRYADEVRGKV